MKNILKNFCTAAAAVMLIFALPLSSEAQTNTMKDKDCEKKECKKNKCDKSDASKKHKCEEWKYDLDIQPGAVSVGEYVKLLKGKKVCVLSNQTGMVTEKTHVLDTLISSGINVVCIMSPEHGFRGNADAGEHVASSVDSKTGIPIRSLYGAKMSKDEMMAGFDVIVFDLQDVGTRFYTYYVTMVRMMANCAQYNKQFIILDRPNPVGFYVDGPILDMKYKSGVGGLPIPIVYGMTIGELATMANGEGWLAYHAGKNVPDKSLRCDLTVIKCKNYTHSKHYKLPVKPSPNLPNMRSVYLYPSICYFEATPVSVGRGTDFPFQVYGSPDMKSGAEINELCLESKSCKDKSKGLKEFVFTPRSTAGAKNPPQLGKECYGTDLRSEPCNNCINKKGIDLSYVIDAYNRSGKPGDKFFNNMFEKEIGQAYVREMIKEGKSAAEIKAIWAADVEQFKKDRKPYLLYPEK